MLASPLAPVEKQVARVSRRLMVQTLLDSLVIAWAGALLLALLWFLAQPWVAGHNDETLRWSVAGSLFALATLGALARAWLRAPSQLTAALAMDHQFALRERVTTSLTLPEDMKQSPAALALLHDVTQRVAKLDVSSRFPLRLTWSALMVPGFAALLALVALMYDPAISPARANTNKDKTQLVVNADEIKKKMDDLRKAKAEKKDPAKNEDLKKLDEALNKLLEQPLDPNNKEEVRERLSQLRPVEEKIKERMDDLRDKADKNKQVKDALKNIKRDDVKNPDKKPGEDELGQDLKDALAKGDMKKAVDVLEKLEKKLKDGKLNAEERKEVEKQLDDLKRQLERVADKQDQKEQAEQKFEDGKIDKEELERELDRIQADAELLKELQELAKKLGKCKEGMEKGDWQQMKMDLKDLVEMLKQMDLDNQDLQDLENQQRMLIEMRQAMQNGLNGPGNQPGGNQGKDGPGGAKREFAPDGPTTSKNERQKLQEDEKGKLRVVGYGQGGTFSRVPAREVGGAFRQAVQEAPEAMDRQRVPPEYADFLRGYYENLGGQGKKAP